MANTEIASGSNTSMVDRPLWLQAKAGDTAISYSAGDYRALIEAAFPSEGVLGAGHFKVTQNGLGDGTINVAAGSGVITGDGGTNLGAYLVKTSGSVNLTVPVAPSGVTRTSRVIARVRDSQVITGTQYDWTLEILEDTGAGTPSLPGSSINLGTIARTGATAVLTAGITDGRALARRDPVNAWGIVGGQEWASTGAQLGSNINSAAQSILTSGPVTTVTGRRYRIRAHFASVVTANNATDVFYVAENSIAGVTRASRVYEARKVNTAYENDVVGEFDETAGASKSFVLCAYQFGSGGGAAHDIQIFRFSSGQSDRAGITVEDVGPAGLITLNA